MRTDMDNNDILRRVRYALDIGNAAMREIFSLAGHAITEADILDMLRAEDEEGYAPCSDRLLGLFLDGLIDQRRGKRDAVPGKPPATGERLTNNLVLKKLRIALDYSDADIMETIRLGGFEITKSGLAALFRKRGHRNYKPCGDQIMKKFLQGLAVRLRS